MKKSYHHRGVTLLELMITVAIIGILAAIVYPSYRDHMMRTNRGTEGLAILTDLVARQEQFFSRNSTYTLDPADLGFAASGITPKGLYQITITADTINPPACNDIRRCFTITADARAGQLDDTQCLTMSIDSRGARTSAPQATGCWR